MQKKKLESKVASLREFVVNICSALLTEGFVIQKPTDVRLNQLGWMFQDQNELIPWFICQILNCK